MLKLSLILFFSESLFFSIQAQENRKEVFNVYLIGDAGELSVKVAPYKDTLQYQLTHDNLPHCILFLGDNIYPEGMPFVGNRRRALAEEILKAQIELVNVNQEKILFIPGNHDWKRGRVEGYEYLLNQQAWIDSLNNERIKLLPKAGCPGPVELQLSPDLVLIALNTQWFLNKRNAPLAEVCGVGSLNESVKKLRDMMLKNKDKRVLLVGHHPIITYGEHGGIFTLKQHLFPLTDVNEYLYIPLPLIGSLYPLYRKVRGSIQDTAHPKNRLFRESVTKVLEEFPGTIYASGHEHTLQYSFKNGVHYVVSGAGVKTSPVKKKGFASYVSSANGFVKLTVFNTLEMEAKYFSTMVRHDLISTYKKELGK